MAHIAISGQGGAQLTPGVEHYLVDRAAVGAELDDQGIEGNGVDHKRDEHLTLPRGQLGIHRAAQRGQRVPSLGLLRGLETAPVRQLVPVRGVQRHARGPPEVPPDLVRHLRMTNRYAQVVNRLSPLKVSSLARIAVSASSVAW